MPERIALMKGKIAGVGKSKHGELDDEVEMGVGTKVMVTENLETDFDITNGSRGKIIAIILNSNEPTLPTVVCSREA